MASKGRWTIWIFSILLVLLDVDQSGIQEAEHYTLTMRERAKPKDNKDIGVL